MTKSKPIKLSRSSINLFQQCHRCFYLKIKHKISQPPTPKISLNLKVDELLKNEFDTFRLSGSAHPIMKQISNHILPFQHPNLQQWRHNFTGIRFLHTKYNFLLFGAVDDLWFDQQSQSIIIIDYKATSSQYPPSKDRLNDYNYQLSFYNWLFQQNHFQTYHTNYILLANAHTSEKVFQNNLHFSTQLLSLPHNPDWIDETLSQIYDLLNKQNLPLETPSCLYCKYYSKIQQKTSQSSLPF